MRNTLKLSSVAILLIGFITGCQPELELVPVHGKVTYKGKPLEYGSVMLQPEGSGPLARGSIQSDGTFILQTTTSSDGVRPGKCRVRITAYAAQNSSEQADTERELILGESAIPEKYNNFGTSGLTVDVTQEMELPLVIDLK